MPTVEQPQPQSALGNSVSSKGTNKGEGAPLDQPSRELVNLRYPIDLGTDSIYKHLMRINVYKQRNSKFKPPILGPNNFDDTKAGASKAKAIDTSEVLVGGTAAALVGAAGKISSLIGSAAARGAAVAKGRSVIATQRAAGQAGQITESLVNGAGKLVTGVVGIGGIAGKGLERKTIKEPVAYISLYMPETLVFTDRHDFDPVSVTEALGTSGIAGAIAGGGGYTSGELAGRAAQQSGLFGDGVVDVSIFGEGYALNPQLEILYKGSKNRQFVFSFKFTPRSQQEAEQVESIIKTLRFHSAPEYAKELNAARYFIPPSEYDIEFYIGSSRNTHLPRIAQCVLENIDVNYAAGGQYSTFVDGMPVEISMQLTFTETVILTKEDIDSGF
jgi:hypothetical protein